MNAAHADIRFEDVTKDSGIDFVHTDGSSGERYIVETVASGLALFDYDGDGYTDLYFLNGAPLPGTEEAEKPPRNALWRNQGDWRFTDVTETSGLGDSGYGLGVAVGDYDNDGFPDIFINNFGPNTLYRNNGDGTFADVTAKAGVRGADDAVGAGAAFLDIDRDGHLDLFVSNYVDFSYEEHRVVRFSGHPAYVGPLDYPPTPDRLYRNNGDGTFTDISESSGIGDHSGAGMGVVCADFNESGATDILVGNDMGANFLFINDGAGKFQEQGALSGIGYDYVGRTQGTMGVDAGDIDNDGRMDVYATSYQQEPATLYKKIGNGLFEDVTRQAGAGEGTLRYVTWGVGIEDFDNDGHRDLFVASGHLHDNVALFDNTTSYHAPNFVFQNKDDGRFENVSDEAGPGLQVKRSSRGAGFADLDNNGLIDAVILNSRREPTILRNGTTTENNWIQVRLVGTDSNRDGIGARIEVTSGELSMVGEMRSGRGYQSDYGKRLHFGLGDREPDRLEVRWPSGRIDRFESIEPNQILTVREGESGFGETNDKAR